MTKKKKSVIVNTTSKDNKAASKSKAPATPKKRKRAKEEKEVKAVGKKLKTATSPQRSDQGSLGASNNSDALFYISSMSQASANTSKFSSIKQQSKSKLAAVCGV